MSLDFAATDRAVHAPPLYHWRRCTSSCCLCCRSAHTTSSPRPVPDHAGAVRRAEINSFFAAPTLWTALAQHPDLVERDLSSLRKAYYGASIMPGPILERLRQRLPKLGFYNCFGQSELGPLCAVLRPEEHDDHPGSAGRPVMFVETRVVNADGSNVGPGEEARSSTGRRSCVKATGTVLTPLLRHSTTTGSIPATSSRSTTTASSKSSTGSRT